MRIENNHAHADTRYRLIDVIDFVNLFNNCLEAKRMNYLSLTVHLPYEIQHYKKYKNLRLGYLYIGWGEILKRIIGVKLYWENAPEENYGKWDLKSGQTLWTKVPKNIELCLDTGHLIIGEKSVESARLKINKTLRERGGQIKHLHLHVNNLKSDQHINSEKEIIKILSHKIYSNLVKNRSYIFEKGE